MREPDLIWLNLPKNLNFEIKKWTNSTIYIPSGAVIVSDSSQIATDPNQGLDILVVPPSQMGEVEIKMEIDDTGQLLCSLFMIQYEWKTQKIWREPHKLIKAWALMQSTFLSVAPPLLINPSPIENPKKRQENAIAIVQMIVTHPICMVSLINLIN